MLLGAFRGGNPHERIVGDAEFCPPSMLSVCQEGEMGVSGPRDEALGFPGSLRLANYMGAKRDNLQRAKGRTEILTFALFQAFQSACLWERLRATFENSALTTRP